jgi:hypothetical protein
LEKRGQGREIKRIPPQHLFEDLRIKMQTLELENELTKSKNKTRECYLKIDIQQTIESDA